MTAQLIHSPLRTPALVVPILPGLRTVSHARRDTTAHRPLRLQLPVQMVPTRLEVQQAAPSVPKTMTAPQRRLLLPVLEPNGQLWAYLHAHPAPMVTIAQEMHPFHVPQDTSRTAPSHVLPAQLVSIVMILRRPPVTHKHALMVTGQLVVRSPVLSALQGMLAQAASRLSVMVMVNGLSPDRLHAAHTQKARSRAPCKQLSLRAAHKVTIRLATMVFAMFVKKETIVMAQLRLDAQGSAPRHHLLQAFVLTGVIA